MIINEDNYKKGFGRLTLFSGAGQSLTDNIEFTLTAKPFNYSITLNLENLAVNQTMPYTLESAVEPIVFKLTTLRLTHVVPYNLNDVITYLGKNGILGTYVRESNTVGYLSMQINTKVIDGETVTTNKLINRNILCTINAERIKYSITVKGDVTGDTRSLIPADSNPEYINSNGYAALDFTAADGYRVPSIMPATTGASVLYKILDPKTNKKCRLIFTNPTDDIKVHINGELIDSTEVNYLCFTSKSDNAAKISFVKTSNAPEGYAPLLQYSTDEKATWIDYTYGAEITLANSETCYFAGNNLIALNYLNFNINAAESVIVNENPAVEASGNIMSLMDRTCRCIDYEMPDECFKQLFANCTYLSRAPELPATAISNSCYYEMFNNCTNLIEIPDLLSGTLKDYCYYGMFAGCNSITSVKSLSSASTMATSCYQLMFSSCTNLVTVPKLYSKVLVENCYSQMFSGCTSLYVSDTSIIEAQNVWNIPANDTTISGPTQINMFSGCLGTRESDDLNTTSGNSHTYYTQNQAI